MNDLLIRWDCPDWQFCKQPPQTPFCSDQMSQAVWSGGSANGWAISGPFPGDNVTGSGTWGRVPGPLFANWRLFSCVADLFRRTFDPLTFHRRIAVNEYFPMFVSLSSISYGTPHA